MKTTNSELANRLAALERHNRNLQRGLVGTFCILAVISCVAAQKPAEKLIETNELVIRDSKGTVRCRLMADPKEGAVQYFYDVTGKERIRLTADQDGNARLRLYDEDGTIRAGAFALSDKHKDTPGDAGVFAFGGGDKAKGPQSAQGGISIRAQKNRTSQLTVNGPEEFKTGVALGVAEGTAYQLCYGSNGNRRVAITASPDGDAGLFLFDPNGKDRGHFATSRKSVTVLTLNDENEKARIKSIVIPKGTGGTGIAADGFASHQLLDSKAMLRTDTSVYADGQVSTDYYDNNGKLRLSSVVNSDRNALHQLFDPSGALRVYSGAYGNGESGQAVLGKTGTAKVSTSVSADDSLSHYVERSAAANAWDAYRTTRDVIQAGQDLKTLYDALNK